jgi:hypothetical protein
MNSMGTYPALSGLRLDRVFAFSDRMSFLIPHHWVDEEEGDDNSYLYYAQDGSEGWLRASLLSVKKNGTATTESLKLENLREAQEKGQELLECGENIIRRYREYSEREGTPICNCYWIVSQCVSADLCTLLSLLTQFPRSG